MSFQAAAGLTGLVVAVVVFVGTVAVGLWVLTMWREHERGDYD